MGQQDAKQAVQIVARIQAESTQQLRQPALAAMYSHYAEDGDDDWQYQREAEQFEQQATAGEATPGQGAGHWNGKTQAQQCGEQRLSQTETQYMAQIGICEQAGEGEGSRLP